MLEHPCVVINSAGERTLEGNILTLPAVCIGSADPDITAGSLVRIADTSGRFLGWGYYNASSRLPLRFLTEETDPPDRTLLARRIRSAWRFREPHFDPSESFRWIYSESDGLPGLIADWFSGHLVIQTTTAGMERFLPDLLDVFREYQPGSISLANDSLPRTKEGLELYRRIISRTSEPPWRIKSNGLTYYLDPLTGHKTGFFLDQRDNRRLAAGICAGRKVLDACCYSGAFAIEAAAADAADVLAIDIFEPALKFGLLAAEANKLSGRCRFMRAEIFQYLSQSDPDRMFDVIFLDPPSFVRGGNRSRRNIANYKKLNALAVRHMAPGGTLVTSICSYHVGLDEFYTLLGQAVRECGRTARIWMTCGAGRDHPLLPGMPELDYLKCVFLSFED